MIMKVKELLKELSKIKDKERDIQILIGDEERDYEGCEVFTLMRTDDGCDRDMPVEIFMDTKDVYNIDDVFQNIVHTFTKEARL